MKAHAIRIGRSPNGGPARIGVTARLRAITVIATALALLSGLFVSVSPAEPAEAAVGDCESLATLVLDEVIAISAELDTDGSFAPPFGPPLTALPAFCRVSLTVDPAINIEVWLPTDTYNSRFQAVGGGGYAGSVSFGAMAGALRGGYATASTDTGHSGFSGDFAFNPDGTLNFGLIEDFASRSLFELTEKSQILIEEFYGGEAAYSYWNGCSTGGRQGLMLAQRMPEAYDGILSAAPAIHWDRFIPAELWPQVVMQQELGAPICQDKLAFATQAAVEACDGRDGVEDGIIADPSGCRFDAKSLVGEVTPDLNPNDGVECGEFTKDDATVVNAIWDGARAVRGHAPKQGKFLWYGLSRGAPLNALAGTNPFIIAVQHMQWAQQDQTFDWTSLDYRGFTDGFRESQRLFNDVIGTDDPNLRDFRNAGGKVLLWHGWYDQLIFPEGTIDYYERVVHKMGGWQRVAKFARLFMAPGVFHCAGGLGATQFDAFGALVAWVEQGDAPSRIIASGVNPGDGEAVTRPLCLYPRVARYDGKGDPNQAASFECKSSFGRHGRNG